MKEKLLQFFTGKMGKAVYISIASAVVCGVVVITSTVIVHNNNKKIDSVLENLSASESVAELSSENVTESVSDTDNTDSGAQAKSPNGEPAGDKALQYLAEYEKLTAEYERKRAELAQETLMTAATKRKATSRPEPQLLSPDNGMFKTKEDYDVYLEEFQRRHSQWEQESRQAEIEEGEAQRKADEEKARASEAHRKLDALDAQYEKDVAALKAKYGM